MKSVEEEKNTAIPTDETADELNACPEKPERLVGVPIGMYHCPFCGMMLIAGLTHPKRSVEDDY